MPPPPDELTDRGIQEWERWFRSWWAVNWTPEYLGSIETAILLFDSAVGRRELKNAEQMRIAMDAIGCTYKGQQDRRWTPPAKPEAPASPSEQPKASRYGHLRAVGAG